MSLPRNLSHNTLNAIVDRLNLREIQNNGKSYHKSNASVQLPFGTFEVEVDIRIFKGEGIADLVYAGIVAAPAVDSHMIFAFTPEDSAVPHFTLDSIGSFIAGQQILAYHLDLVPRVDPGANLSYLRQAYNKLDNTYNKTQSLEGLTKAQISPLQHALMSPWMLTHRATQEAFEQLPAAIDAYLEQWFSLVETGINTSVSADQLKTRDQANRAAIFNPEVDPVWGRITPLIGAEISAHLIDILKNGFDSVQPLNHNDAQQADSALQPV